MDDYPVGFRSALSIASQAAVEGWDVPVEKRQELVDTLIRACQEARVPKYKIRAFDSLTALIDRWLAAEKLSIEREKLSIEREKIEAARNGIAGAGAPRLIIPDADPRADES